MSTPDASREKAPVDTATPEQGQRIALLLWYGTWLASMIIAAGLTLDLLHRVGGHVPHGISGFSVMKIGIALFILLPIARVILMLFTFLHQRDYLYTAISALVIAIIAAGFWVGL